MTNKLIKLYLFSFLFSAHVWAVGLYDAPKAHENSPTTSSSSKQDAPASAPCTQSITPADEKHISEFIERSKELRKNLDSDNTLNTQLNNLIDDYSKKISASGLKALSAVYMREQFIQLANGLQNDPSINKAFKDFNSATEERIAERKRYKDAGFFKRLSGDADKALIDSGNTVTKKMNAFIASIKASSKIDPAYKEKLIKSLINMLMAENDADANIASAVADRYEGYTAIAKTVRNGFAGAGLMVGGLIVGGATVPAGATLIGSTTATLGTSGAATVGFLSSAAMGTAAGAVAGAGYGLLRGEAAMIAKSTLSDDSFMCSLVQEQTQHSQQVYKDALKFAAVGATIGGGAGYLAAKGGIYALIAEGGGAALAAAGSVTSAWGATKEGLESKALFQKAAQASAQGDEATARSLVKQAREKAVEAGLSGVDSVLAGVAAAKTTQSFKQSLKEAPQSIAQIAESQISNKVATELTNKGHEEWRKNYQDQMKAQGKPITEPREKPVPLQESEAAEAALSRLTNEGYKGLAVKDGKLVQDINRPAKEIVPALNQKLNGGPAQDYAKKLVGKKVESEEDIAKMAADVHEVWMKHNSWEKDQKPHLFKKYNQLSADEQIKDLNVVEAVLRAQNDGKIPKEAEKILSNYRTKIEKQIAQDNQQLASAISLLEELNKSGSISAEDFAIIKQSKSKREYDDNLKKIFEKKEAEHKAEFKLIKERREPIYDSGMRYYLEEASRNGTLRKGLAGKSYSEIRESPEFLKDYDSYALKVQSLPLEEKERALSKFAAEWLYPPKSP